MEPIYRFMFTLRDAGTTNMFGEISKIMESFPEMTEKDVQNKIFYWMSNYTELYAEWMAHKKS